MSDFWRRNGVVGVGVEKWDFGPLLLGTGRHNPSVIGLI